MWPQSRIVPAARPAALAFGKDPVEQPMRLDLAEPPLPVADEHHRGLALDHEGDSDPVIAPLQESDVLGHAEHAVRVVPPQVGTDKALGDEPCIVDRARRQP